MVETALVSLVIGTVVVFTAFFAFAFLCSSPGARARFLQTLRKEWEDVKECHRREKAKYEEAKKKYESRF